MKRIGPHVSTSGGVQMAPLNARAIGAAAFGLFTKNQRRWVARPLESATIDAYRKNLAKAGYLPHHALAHDSYLINIGHPDIDLREQSYAALVDELTRCSRLGIPGLNIHPGSHLRQISEEECLDNIAGCINRALKETAGVSVVLENTAGQGSNVGYRFEHIAAIIDSVEDKSRIGFCIDTCHTFAAGYDIRTRSGYEETMASIEKTIGIRYLRGAHLNDAKVQLGSHLDRHQSIGKGTLGIDTFRFIMNDPRFDEIPLVLETIDESLWSREIAELYGLVSDAAPVSLEG